MERNKSPTVALVIGVIVGFALALISTAQEIKLCHDVYKTCVEDRAALRAGLEQCK